MRRLCCSFVVSLLVVPAGAATVLERTIRVSIQPDGKTREAHTIRVRLEKESDIGRYSPYPILLDLNRKVVRAQGTIQKADGSTVRLDKKALDTVSATSTDELHSSQRYRTVSFDDAAVGSTIALTYEVEVAPYFPAAQFVLVGEDSVEALSVVIEGAGGLRHAVFGPADPAIAIAATDARISVEGRNLAGRPELDWADARAGVTLLHVSWGPRRTWSDVGDWYVDLIRNLPRAPAELRADAAPLKGATARATLEATLEFVRQKVRYVAVQVGVGGYVPHAPADVRKKGWGDCKDKAILMIDLLRFSGLEAHPALILSDDTDRVEPGFPSPFQFNHMVVALSAADIPGAEGVLSSEGYVFVDPTQERGGLEYVHSGILDQHALIVRPRESRLVRTPLRPFSQRHLDLRLETGPSGRLEGRMTYELLGESGYAIQHALASQTRDEKNALAASLVREVTAGFEAGQTVVEADPTRSDRAHVASSVRGGTPFGPSNATLRLPWRIATPAPAIIEGRTEPVVLRPGVTEGVWTIGLPQGLCPPQATPPSVRNDVGSFEQSLEVQAGKVVIRRRTTIAARVVEAAGFASLRELALAEHRAAARTLRFNCDP